MKLGRKKKHKVPWKLVGAAGVAGVAATGVAVARHKRNAREDMEPDDIRAALHSRLEGVSSTGEPSGASPPPPA